MERDKWACTNCGATEKELQVHHIQYLPKTEPFNYPDKLLTTLCVDCHHSETVLQTMAKMKVSIADWKLLEFAFRNVPNYKMPEFIKRVFQLSTEI